MTYTLPVQRTWSVGDIATAAEMNANVRDSVNFLLNKPKARVYISGTFNLGNATWAQIAGVYTVDYDPYSLWSSASSVFYFNEPGIWRVHGRLEFPSNATGLRGAAFAWSSTSFDTNRQALGPSTGYVCTDINTEGTIPNTSNQYVRLMGYQSSGATMSLNANGEFSCEFLGSS